MIAELLAEDELERNMERADIHKGVFKRENNVCIHPVTQIHSIIKWAIFFQNSANRQANQIKSITSMVEVNIAGESKKAISCCIKKQQQWVDIDLEN